MSKETEDLIEKNKNALMQEAGRSFNVIIEIINDIVNDEMTGDPAKDLDLVRQQLMGLSLNVGFLGAVMNQLFIFLTGVVPEDEEDQPMGFASMMEEATRKKEAKKKKKKGEDDD